MVALTVFVTSHTATEVHSAKGLLAFPVRRLPLLKMLHGYSLSMFIDRGPPSTIVSDRGPQFVSAFWDEFCRMLGVKLKLYSIPYSDRRADRDCESAYCQLTETLHPLWATKGDAIRNIVMQGLSILPILRWIYNFVSSTVKSPGEKVVRETFHSPKV